VIRALALSIALLAAPLAAHAAEAMRGVALVIGESKYEQLPALTNPSKDARDIDRLLGDLGFEVDRVLNADGEELHDAIAISTSKPGSFSFGAEKNVMAMHLSGPSGSGDLGYFMQTFGQSNRNNPPRPLTGSPLQPLLLMQSPVVTDRVRAADASRVDRLLASYPQDNERVVDELFMATLTRLPSTEEKAVALEALARDRVEGAQNLQWALINQVEFFFNY